MYSSDLFIITSNRRSRNKFTENLIKLRMAGDFSCEIILAENDRKPNACSFQTTTWRCRKTTRRSANGFNEHNEQNSENNKRKERDNDIKRRWEPLKRMRARVLDKAFEH